MSGPLAARDHVFFDLDGTLIDSQEGITASLRACLRDLGRPVPPAKDLLWCIGVPLQEVCAKLLGTDDPETVGKAVDAYRRHYWDEDWRKGRLYPGVLGLLGSLGASGRKLYLATHKLEKEVGRILEHFGLAKTFQGVFGYDDRRPGDKSVILRRGLEGSRAHPVDSVMIGDRDQDIQAAKVCGTASIAVTYGYGSPGELKAAAPDFTCGGVPELATLLLPSS